MNTPFILAQWAQRHAIPAPALEDLFKTMATAGEFEVTEKPSGSSESFVQSAVRLEAPYFNVHLFRNNVGALKDVTGRPVRYGLANESADENKVRKSADLIGWRSFVIQPRHVGRKIAQFVSRECKKKGWTWSGDSRETAQLNWAMLVASAGGDASFVAGPGSFTNEV